MNLMNTIRFEVILINHLVLKDQRADKDEPYQHDECVSLFSILIITVEPIGEFMLKGIRRPMMTYNVLEPLSSNRT